MVSYSLHTDHFVNFCDVLHMLQNTSLLRWEIHLYVNIVFRMNLGIILVQENTVIGSLPGFIPSLAIDSYSTRHEFPPTEQTLSLIRQLLVASNM